MAEQNKLENIFSYSFPANHLLQISIVRQVPDQSYKREYFCFITLAPCNVNQQTGNRGYDFNNRITMKVDGHQIGALGHALRSLAKDEKAVGTYSIFVNTNKSSYGQPGQSGGGKSLGMQRSQTTPKQGSNQQPQPTVVLYFRSGQANPLAYSLQPAMALSVADVCEFIATKCRELEYARGPVTAQTGAYQNPGFGRQVPPMGQTPPPQNNNVAGNFAGAFGNFAPDDDVPF